tara:strand:- start:1089 stop:2708 length:1620 start_codon:yes stop_codon:yes gene_type:complete
MTNNSKVFALKYRPQTFKDLVGHEEISKAIFNSIKNNNPSNAFLFTGIRGIGKTTFARIVAKALNCENGVENLCEKNFCSNCSSIINSNHIDVLEIDAASRTGVDDVRELIEFSRYRPSVARYKIFIIDEVHMLSKQAFNALLKTLEEPPEYLKFIFATTEIKKIPITVLSRCQRYNLSRIGSDELFNHLKDISIKEKKNVEEKALKLITKISEGSVRDALSLLDRALISNSEKNLTLKNVQEIFGYVNKSSYIELLELIFKGDEELVLKHFREIYKSGVDPNNFLNEFLEVLYYLKNISYINLDGNNFQLNDIEHQKISSLSKLINTNAIFLFWEFTLKTIREINLVSNPNLSIEIFLLQLLYLSKKKVKKELDPVELNINEKRRSDNKINLSKKESINQIKNLKQEDDKVDKNNDNYNKITNFDDLIKICIQKKEMKLKYELENNVNLVLFTNNRIEISFNANLNKDFVKELSEKLYKWTTTRWIISFSNEQGSITKKEEKKLSRDKNINKYKNSNEYIDLLNLIPDLELIDVKKND